MATKCYLVLLDDQGQEGLVEVVNPDQAQALIDSTQPWPNDALDILRKYLVVPIPAGYVATGFKELEE